MTPSFPRDGVSGKPGGIQDRTGEQGMTTSTQTSPQTPTQTLTTTQVYRVYIKTTPQAIWDAITRPEWTAATATPGWPSTTCVPAARIGSGQPSNSRRRPAHRAT